MKGFDEYLRRSIRTVASFSASDEGDRHQHQQDWSYHYVDYASLKRTIETYAERRSALKKMLRDNGGSTGGVGIAGVYRQGHGGIAERDLNGLLPASSPSASRGGGRGVGAEGEGGYYFRYDDDHRIDSTAPAAAAQRTVLSSSEAVRRMSNAERSDFCRRLDAELERAASFYGRRLATLAGRVSKFVTDMTQEIPEEEGEDGDDEAAAKNELRSSPSAASEAAIEAASSGGCGGCGTEGLMGAGGGGDGSAGAAASSSSAAAARDDEREASYLGRELLELYAFAVVNVLAVRQALLRYDAFVRTYDGQPLSQWYLLHREGPAAYASWAAGGYDDVDAVSGIFHLDGFDSVAESYVGGAEDAVERIERRRSLIRRRRRSSKAPGSVTSTTTAKATATATATTAVHDFQAQLESFRHLLASSHRSVERASSGDVVLRDKIVASYRRQRHYFLLGTGSRRGLALEPRFLIRMHGRHLKKEMRAVALWRESRRDEEGDGFVIRDEEEEAAGAAEVETIDPENVLPLILNLLACALHMMNNYIIEPSSAYYANALGSSDAMSGIMIGFSFWFALGASVGYSFWTNRSYRHPMIFAATLSCVGNFLYGTAYGLESMQVCLLGRAITGLGAMRVINRRYVADATPFSLRTAASAAFALTTAVGAALGPGLAILLDLFDFEFYLPFLGKQVFNGMTGPGYFMALVWGLYLIVLVIFFKEPSRSGLDELKRREAIASGEKDEEDPTASSAALYEKDEAMERDASSLSGYKSMSYDAAAVEIERDSARGGGAFPCFRHLTRAVLLCMSLIFMKRITLECIVGSTSVITKNRYQWSIKNVGTLHLVNGMIVIPISILSGWLSQFYEDRYLAVWLLSITLFGMTLLLDVADFVSTESESYNEGHWLAVGPGRYIAGSLIAFSGIEACESFTASLMSKVVPSALAAGTFNSGLLATLVGTSGRAVGDALITAMGLLSIRNLLNSLVLPGASLVIISIVLVRRNYDILAF